ncbi:hypothetical protein E2C01_097296 [Portunus trituberculatus]|uniref:Uncharacterized protein n=1 Tax=Portunus trituberculatus TaxID=210409 RepID=A0A5B7K022_PORTR|nr:hypothetical protein [Portunus trituberculatus]
MTQKKRKVAVAQTLATPHVGARKGRNCEGRGKEQCIRLNIGSGAVDPSVNYGTITDAPHVDDGVIPSSPLITCCAAWGDASRQALPLFFFPYLS